MDKSAIPGKIGRVFRLREAYNVKLTQMDEFQAEAEYTGDMKIKETVQWLPEEATLEIIMQDNSILAGSTEPEINRHIGHPVHLDGFGFVIMEGQGKAIFAHE